MFRDMNYKEYIMKKLKSMIAVILCCILCSTSVAAAVPAWTNVNGVFYNDKGEVIKGALAKGIDVSHYQGDIDWAKVKQTDIEFAIIRCGYGDDDRSQDDLYFAQNIQGCENNNIPYGIYIYSHATNTEMAKSEADHVLRLVSETNAKPTFPIYYDIEDKTQESLSGTILGDIAETFCNEMIKAGYKVGIYSNLTWWNNRLTDKRFEKWDKWVAQFNSNCDYGSQYNIWQYTENGIVDGIPAGVDVNILLSRECSVSGHTYVLQSVTRKATTTQSGAAIYQCKICGSEKTEQIPIIKSISLSKTSYVYNGKTIKPAVTIKDGAGNIISKSYYTVAYSGNVKPGQASVKITFKGLYEGNMTKKFMIKPAKIKISKAVNQKGRKIKLTWKKVKGVSGYEICYAKNKTFKKGKKVVTAKSSAKTKVISKLGKNQIYYIRIRAYKKISGKKVYGVWSSKKSVKIVK